MNPGCTSGLNPENHHIIPKSRGGKDKYENYIILCSKCHRRSENHRDYKTKVIILWTWKFYTESKIDGGKGYELPTVSQRNIEPEEIQGEGSTKILRQEMQNEVSQRKQRSYHRAIKKKTRRTGREVKCPVCHKEFKSNGQMRKNLIHCRLS